MFCILVATFGVAACVPTTSTINNGLSIPNHKHILSISSTDVQLKDGLTQLLSSDFINIYPHHKDGGYNLILTKKSSKFTAFDKPQLFGMLRKELRPTSVITNYSLTTFAGEILTSGEIISMGEEQTVITPSLTYETSLTPIIIEDIAKQIQPVLEQNLNIRPWQAVIVAKKDYRHVIIQSSKYEGINIGDMFTAPNGALLQVVTFELGQAVLTVLEGLLPDIGSSLLVIQNLSQN